MDNPLLSEKQPLYKFVLGKGDDAQAQELSKFALKGFEPIFITTNNAQVIVLTQNRSTE